jgi:iron-sulfur cluster assembly protein
MALDEPAETDDVINEKGITFLIDKDLLNEVKPITVDFIDTPQASGFKVTGNLPKADGCGSSCGSSCSC